LFYPGAVAVLMGIGLVALATRVPPEVIE
jgi:hypothetical protein